MSFTCENFQVYLSIWGVPEVCQMQYSNTKKTQEQQEDCKMTNKQYAEEIDTRGNKRVV